MMPAGAALNGRGIKAEHLAEHLGRVLADGVGGGAADAAGSL